MVTLLFGIAMLIICMPQVDSAYDYIEDRDCATFFQEKNFHGYRFTLKDFDQSVDLPNEHRQSNNGLLKLSAANVKSRCHLEYCTLEYFGGTCTIFNNTDRIYSSDHFFENVGNVKSAKCACQRKCSCKDIFIPKDFSENPILGRGYFEGGCSTCNSEYVALRTCDPSPFWQQQQRKLEAVILRTGCNLTVYSEQNFKGTQTVIVGPISEGAIEAASYKIFCSDADFVEPSPRPLPPEINQSIGTMTIPEKLEELRNLRFYNKSIHNLHNMVFRKADSAVHHLNRSHKYVYIVVIGTRDPLKTGFPQCQSGPKNQIGECHIPVPLPSYYTSSEVRVITAPMPESIEQIEYSLETSLKKYLSTHEHLKTVTPNAVILYEEFTKDFSNATDSPLQIKLQTVNALRGRLLDKKLTNFVLLIDASKTSLNATEIPYYDTLYATKIRENFDIPKWNTFVWKSEIRPETYFVNGVAKMFNGEHWPRILEQSLRINHDGAQEDFGSVFYEAIFRDDTTPHRSIKQLNDTAVDDSKLQPSPASCSFSPEESLGKPEGAVEKPEAATEASASERTLEVLSNSSTSNELSHWKELEVRVRKLELEQARSRKEFLEFLQGLKLGISKIQESI